MITNDVRVLRATFYEDNYLPPAMLKAGARPTLIRPEWIRLGHNVSHEEAWWSHIDEQKCLNFY